MEDLPFPELIEEKSKWEIIENSKKFQLFKVIGTETKKKYIILIFKIEISKDEFISSIKKMSEYKFPSFPEIIGYEYNHQITKAPTVLYSYIDGNPLKFVINTDEKLDSSFQYMLISTVVFTIKYLIQNHIPICGFKAGNILITKTHEVFIFGVGIQALDSKDYKNSLQRILCDACSEVLDDSFESDGSNEICFSNPLYYNIHSLCDGSKEFDIDIIIDLLISVNFSSFNEKSQFIENYISKLFSKIISDNALFQLYKKSMNQAIQINELSATIDHLNDEIREMNEIVMSLQIDKNHINEISNQINDMKVKYDHSLSVIQSLMLPSAHTKIPMSHTNPGIFSYLIKSQKSVFDHFVVPSQSSGDLYCIIDENNQQNFSSGSGEYEWIQFEFKNPVSVVSLKVQSAHRSFVKTWKFIAYDDDDEKIVLYSTQDDPALNGTNKEVILNVKATSSKKFRFEKYGPNWAGTNFIRIKNIEFYSDDPDYLGGIFKTLVEKAGGDPHKADVYITSSNFDFKRFHKISPSRTLCTLYDEEPPWFQVELTNGKAIVNGYRVQILDNFPITRWKVLGSNDGESWETIHEVDAKPSEISTLMTFNVSSKNPFSLFRFVNTMENTNDDLKLRLKHFDIFGVYLSN